MDYFKIKAVLEKIELNNYQCDCFADNSFDISLYSNDLQYSVMDLLELLVKLKNTYNLSKQSVFDLIGNFTINNILIQIEKSNRNDKAKGG